MGKRIVRKLPKDVVILLNQFQLAAEILGAVRSGSTKDERAEMTMKDEMLKCRYRLEKKLLDQGQVAAHGMRILKAARNRIPTPSPDKS